MRPIVTLAHAVGVVMCLYAIGVMVTPNGGAMGWLQDNTPLTPPMLAVAFAVCGLYVFFCKPHPALFSVLTTPILLYSLASLGFLLSPLGGALTAYVAHTGVWLVINAAIVEKARNRWIS